MYIIQYHAKQRGTISHLRFGTGASRSSSAASISWVGWSSDTGELGSATGGTSSSSLGVWLRSSLRRPPTGPSGSSSPRVTGTGVPGRGSGAVQRSTERGGGDGGSGQFVRAARLVQAKSGDAERERDLDGSWPLLGRTTERDRLRTSERPRGDR